MCGILGLIEYEKANIGSYFKDALASQYNRGPDHGGYIKDENIHLGVRRLKIHDLSDKANQPFKLNNSRIIICFNGAISNFSSLSKIIDPRIHTASDTEILMRAYLKWGTDFFHYLEGMFAFAIYDPVSKEIIIARDHTGIKPLYYYEDTRFFIFSSEIKSIIRHPLISAQVNKELVPEYFSRGHISAPDTLFSRVKQVLPGNYIRISTKVPTNIKTNCYWTPSNHISSCKTPLDVDELDDLLHEKVNDALNADVDVGIQLSGGIDSSLIAKYSQKFAKNKITKSYSVIFDDNKRVLWKPRSEEIYIDQISSYLNMPNKKFLFTSEEIKDSFRKTIFAHEHPLYGASTAMFYLLARHLSGEVKVLLSGEGMDDFFLGYYTKSSLKTVKGDFAFEIPFSIVKKLTKKGQLNIGFEKAEAYILELKKMGVSNLDICSLLDMRFRLHGLLARNERCMMAHSIEARPPFCNHKIIEKRFKIATEELINDYQGKLCIKKVAKKYFSHDFVDRPKIGFSSPYGDFMLDSDIWGHFLKQLNLDILEDYIDTAIIKQINDLEDQKEKLTGTNLKLLFYAVNFQLWLETFF